MSLKQNGWKGDIAPFLEQVSSVAIGSGRIWMFSPHQRLALGLPANDDAAKAVVDLYHPQRWQGHLLKGITKFLAGSKFRTALPAFQTSQESSPVVGWLQQAADAECIGFLGCNPAHGPRCILSGILPDTGARFVAKLGFDESTAAVDREGRFLESVKGRYPGVIIPEGIASGKNWQLLRLPYLGEEGPTNMSDLKVAALLNSWLSNNTRLLGEDPLSKSLLEKVPSTSAPAGWHERMYARQINSALVHGDFAVWNLRLIEGGICALDWEWAEEHGIAGIDLLHGLRQECYMVKSLSPEAAIRWITEKATTSPWKGYLDSTGWEGGIDDWLRLGFLHSHFNARNDSAAMLKLLGIHI